MPGHTARIAALALVAALALMPAGGRAQEPEEAHDAGAHGSAETHVGRHGHAEYRNGLALFLGGTLETAEDQTFGTIGLEYERRLADRWAVQLVVEHVHDFDARVVAAPVGFRLGGTLWAVAGPGLETEPRRFRRQEPHGESPTTDHEEGDGPFFLGVWASSTASISRRAGSSACSRASASTWSVSTASGSRPGSSAWPSATISESGLIEDTPERLATRSRIRAGFEYWLSRNWRFEALSIRDGP